MKIKKVESFTLEECQSYLEMYPDENRHAVEDRMKYLLKQIKDNEEQKEQEEKARQEYNQNDVKWIDIKQFLAERKYRKLSLIIAILYTLLLVPTFLLGASVYFSATTHNLHSAYYYEQDDYTEGLEKLLLNLGVIYPEWHSEYPTSGQYELSQVLPSILVPTYLILIFALLIISGFHSPSLRKIYNIEQEEKVKLFRRTQNIKGLYGLHKCFPTCTTQVLPFAYENIYHCGGNSYICVQGNKKGVYNTAMRRMVIDVAYDSINIMQDGTLAVSRYGVVMKYTTEGYRIIE